MPWREVSKMDERREFVEFAMQEGTNRRALCRRFGIHPDTGYKWLERWLSDGGLADRSRRPHSSPERTESAIEARILAVRDAHPAWGARKIVRYLARECAPHGVRVMSVSPGAVDTAAFRAMFPDTWEERLAAAAAANPMGRGVTVEDCAALVEMLADPELEMVQGQTIATDGGASL